MIEVSRVLITVPVLLFGIFNALLGLFNLQRFDRPIFPMLAILLFIVALLLSLVLVKDLRMPAPAAWLNVPASFAVAALTALGLDSYRPGDYTSWYVTGIGVLLGLTALREHVVAAWVGGAGLTLQILVFGGVSALANSGVIGALLLIFTGQIAARIIANAEREAQGYLASASMTLAETAAKTAARAERTRRIQDTLQGALPMLELIVESQGQLDRHQKLEAKLLEAELRDGIRGRSLNLPELAARVRGLRASGVEVQLLDDGGLDDLSPEERATLIARVVEKLACVSSGKVVIRAVRGEDWRITLAALRQDSAVPDVFVRLP